MNRALALPLRRTQVALSRVLYPASTRIAFDAASVRRTFHTHAPARTPALYALAFGTTAALHSTIARAEAAQAPDIVLYQYEVCPFCNKVRAYLDYHNIPYRVIEVDPLYKTELKELSADYRKVPIAIIDGAQVNGSSEIITRVSGASLESEWISWVDNVLIRLITPNIYRTPGESLQTFAYIADHAKFSALQRATIRYMGAAAMYMVASRKKKEYGIVDERAEMKQALRLWTDALGTSKFLHGDEAPGMADLCVYGVLRAIQEFDTFRELRADNPEFAQWYDRTQAAVGSTTAVPA